MEPAYLQAVETLLTSYDLACRLYRDGSPIVDVDGRPMAYDDLEEAQNIMEHWGLFGLKTLAEVRGESGGGHG